MSEQLKENPLQEELDSKLLELAIIWGPLLAVTIKDHNGDPNALIETFYGYLKNGELRGRIKGFRTNMIELRDLVNNGYIRAQIKEILQETDTEVVKDDQIDKEILSENEIHQAYKNSLPLLRRITFLYKKILEAKG